MSGIKKADRDDRHGEGAQVFDFEAAAGGLVIIEVAVKNGPISGIDISADGARLLVTNYSDNSVSIVNTETCRVTETIDGIDEPFAIAAGGADGNRAYVSTVSTAYDSIAVIDMATRAVVATHPLALSVSDLTVSRDGKYVYAARNGARGADVAILDTTTDQVAVIDIATTPGTTTECVRISSDGTRLYVGTNGPAGGQLVVIATGAQSPDAGSGGRSRWRKKTTKSRGKQAPTGPRVVDTIEIGSSVRDVALSPDGAVAYVASCGADFGAVVDVVDTRTSKISGTRKIGDIGGLVTRLTVSGNGERAYLVSEDRVTVLCTRTQDVLGTLRTNQPSCVAESPDGKHLYIAGYSGIVTVAPVEAAVTSGASDTEQRALDPNRSVDWFLPDLLQYEPALA
ncbi:YncE family protein [Mycobacterium riyadhense]|uniref:Lactonase, 7-bladed beta-propeller n=1 Tax=Mycobacterium riyadhense TaxID=486698 RepID=A0A1X2AZM9_9MYCO|nr:YncE family protein [Mycobacterium riyadhense]MCV7149637.1 YncE family protein [Mycobacterium riyadhense]ORW56549.1 hypothetical protein AWC22_06860 [Mycobacterium riyadhense]VTP03212.1 Lactonase, 7-bladed beta-propeller [Mycobacterium riyadhense]